MNSAAFEVVPASSEADVTRLKEFSDRLFSREISGGGCKENPAFKLSEWRRRSQDLSGMLLEARHKGTGNTAGFAFAHDNETLPNTLHIWLAGVDPAYRRQGVWAALSALAEKTASTRGCQAITINTVPSRFQGMYSYLTSPESGFRELGREMREENGEPYEKVKFIKDLP